VKSADRAGVRESEVQAKRQWPAALHAETRGRIGGDAPEGHDLEIRAIVAGRLEGESLKLGRELCGRLEGAFASRLAPHHRVVRDSEEATLEVRRRDRRVGSSGG